MKDVLPDIANWITAAKQPIALATVVQTWGSAPRKVGAKMAMMASGEISGSVSGGCVEGAVFEAGGEVLASGVPQLLHFGVADETAWEVGLACGGIIEIFVERLQTAVFDFMSQRIEADQFVATATVIQGPAAQLGQKLTLDMQGQTVGSLGDAALDAEVTVLAQKARRSYRHQLTGEIELFIDTVPPAPALVIVGGVHIAIGLASMAQTLGYKTVVIDPRRAFGSAARFPHVDRLIQAWPQKAFAEVQLNTETAVALLTHDPKIDDPALQVVLNSPAFYIGALGSKKTHAKRRARLVEMGFTEEVIDRIHGPIGLSINAQTPAEIALSILAQITQARRA